MATRRDLIRALDAFRALSPQVNLHQIIAFLLVAENEGLLVGHVCALAGFSQSTASRSLRANGVAGTPWAVPPALGLVEACRVSRFASGHAIFLTPAGRDLRDALDAMLAPSQGHAVASAGRRSLAD
ncbi:hypothetical protein [Phenylobacterium sp.]|uniref:hypothetical protein n=1 Tax=Phenylobacterium sp. TaxID=1871053 RepID=UPI0025CD599A|nr:hypothetical protein [Phenylobacterium sp.]